MAANSSAMAPRAMAPTSATGTAKGTVDQRASRPNTTTPSASVTSMVTTAKANGKRNSARMLETGPNGETAMRSNVPATSS